MTGHLFGDRYQVGDTLGFGGMSEVHRGRDLRLGRDVAIKVLRADLARDPSFQARFRREAQNAASLNHPAIVAVYDTGETQGDAGPIPYIVMEFVDGETLRELLKREQSLAPRRAMEIVADVCAALDFSHRHGIVHRDIKPANVMLTKAGAVKVMDFGIARAIADGQNTMTATAAVIGTAQYLSPEQARGEAVDARSDVYSTGCVLFELLTGSPPFTGDSPVAVAYQHVREDPRAPSQVKPGLPRELDAIVLKALNKNPLNRYQTAAEMRSDLVRALSGQAVHATPIMPEEERTQMLRPGPMRVGAGGTGAPPLLAPPRRTMVEDSWAEDEPDRSTKKVWGYIGIGVLCAALLAAGIYFTLNFINTPDSPERVSTPQVQGLTQDAAIALLKDSKLEVGSPIATVASSADLEGKVVRQNPSYGTPVDAGSTVVIIIGSGVDQVSVPEVSGMDEVTARRTLEDLGLEMKTEAQPSNEAEKNTVIKQDPPTGSEVAPGSVVTVTIGSGLQHTLVPGDLIGKTFDEANAILAQNNLTGTPQPTQSSQPLNVVLGYGAGIAEGQNVPYGTPVPLQVSDNSMFKMPNLQQKKPDEAWALLKSPEVGWGGDFLNETPVATTNRAFVGRILASGSGACATGQSPAEGTEQLKSTTIAICVGAVKQVTVPSIVNLTRAEANALLQANGVTNPQWVAAPGVPTPEQAGRVVSVSPGGGSPVDFDAAVTITVWPDLAPETSPPPPGG